MDGKLSRRQFLVGSGATAVALSLTRFDFFRSQALAAGAPDGYKYRNWEDIYRGDWRWDKVVWGSHCVDCYPGTCPWRVYVKDGLVWREEQGATFETIEEGVPDMNPRGCQKGAGFSNALYGPERAKYPLKRVGKRGSAKWKRISWDDALSEWADAILDAIEENGVRSIVFEESPGEGGFTTMAAYLRFASQLGAVTLDADFLISDFNAGEYITFGKFHGASSVDDWFQADLLLIWHMNPVYTRIPSAHFIWEARYKGAEVYSIAPDYNPSSIHADWWLAVRPSTDAALGLGMARVIIDEGIYNASFVKEQTDLPLLVRLDTRKFLRASDLKEGESEEQFYFYDTSAGKVVPAPRGNLTLEVDPALDGKFEVTLSGGQQVEVTPVFALLKERLADYTPEQAAKICGVEPDTIRTLARKIAKNKTHILVGWNSAKHYHGDLIERTMCLLLALTGNWGKKGTGIRGWMAGMIDGFFGLMEMTKPGATGFQEFLADLFKTRDKMRQEDPTKTDEMIAIAFERGLAEREGLTPPHFFWYHHCGYRDIWNNKQWGDEKMKHPFDFYFKESVKRGTWGGFVRPDARTEPRVFVLVAGNTLRRTRGGAKMLLENLWPKLKKIVTVDYRMNTTGLYSDLFLPAAVHYEKVNFGIPTVHLMYALYSDKAAEAPGEGLSEWQIFVRLARKLEERAKARGMKEYTDADGKTRRLDDFYRRFTLEETLVSDEQLCEQIIGGTVTTGALPRGTTLETFKEKGHIRFTGLGITGHALNQASDLKADETHNPFRWHTEKKLPFPTLTRRAQFYIDHDWFLGAGEELPMHKDFPKMGGNYPFTLTSGHQRWSIHSINVVNALQLRIHRGKPFMFMNPSDATAKNITDDDTVKVWNDMGAFEVSVKISSSVRPGQVIIYHAWEPYMFKDWKPYDIAIPGMIKYLHLVQGYGHLNYWPWNWAPAMVDRCVAVEVEKV